MALEPVHPPTKAAAAFVELQAAIQSGRLPEGSRITLTQLAGELGMSLTPVREALKLLEAQGLVVHRPHYGTVVAKSSTENIDEIYMLRTLLEPLAARYACTNASDEQIEESRQKLEDFNKALTAGDLHLIPALNAEFHSTIYRASGMPYLITLIDHLWRGIPYQAISLSGRLTESAREHAEIWHLFHQRDAEALEAAMRQHISSGAQAAADTLAHAASGGASAAGA